MPAHVEPYDAATLTRWVQQRGCSFIRQRGSHTHWITPDGIRIGLTDPGSNHPVTSETARHVASAFNITLHDLRNELGYGSTRGRPRNKPARLTPLPAAAPVTPIADTADTLRRISETIARSGPCRKADCAQARRLERYVTNIVAWYDDITSGRVA